MAAKNKSFVSGRPVKKKNNRSLLIIVLVLAIGLTAWLIFRHFNKSDNQASTSSSKTSSSTATGSHAPAAPSTGKSASSNGGGQIGSTIQPLKAPYGTFVSNHKPGQDGAPTAINSVCITTPGATCYISFTQGGITKQLPSKTVGADGYANWNSWSAKEIGLTNGSWQVTAVASSGNQSLSTKDNIALEIQ